MAPKLRVVISSSSSAYPPHQPIDVNSPKPTPLETSSFKGEISVWIKGYEGDHKGGEGDEYFGQEGREGMTYAIVIKGMSLFFSLSLSRKMEEEIEGGRLMIGKFLEDVDADQVLWGNVFEHPIRDNLPWGTAIATKFM
jgi:hypothetical protein